MKPMRLTNYNCGILSARIQIINEQTNKWQTLAECMDTPNSIKQAIRGLHGCLWVVNGLGERRYLGEQ